MSDPRVLLSAKGLRIGFGGVRAADGIDLEVYDGERLAIIGPNGAGKTTFINICTGYLRPEAGEVLFEGRAITGRSPKAITRLGIARAFQIPQLFLEDTALENLLIAGAARAGIWQPWKRLDKLPIEGEMRELLDLVGLAAVADKPVAEQPEGTRKLIDIAVALALEPKLLLLDEPTSGVSSAEKFEIMDRLIAVLSVKRVTSVFVEHDMEVVSRYADRVAVWSRGQIAAQGPPLEVLQDEAVLRDVVGL